MSQLHKVPRRTKSRHHKESKPASTHSFLLDQEQNQLTLKAKQQLQHFSSSFHWQSQHRSKINSKVKLLDDWQPPQGQKSYLNLNENHQNPTKIQSLRRARIKTQHSLYDTVKTTQKGCYRRNFRKDFEVSQSFRASAQGSSLNLSFKNITTLTSPYNDENYLKYRPSTGKKKQVQKKIITIVPYPQDGSHSEKKSRRQLKSESSYTPINKVGVYDINGGSLSNVVVKKPIAIKNKVHNRNFYMSKTDKKMGQQYSSSRLIGNSCQKEGNGYLKKTHMSALNDVTYSSYKQQRGKWVSSKNQKCNIRRVYHVDADSPLKREFDTISKLLKEQINNLKISQDHHNHSKTIISLSKC